MAGILFGHTFFSQLPSKSVLCVLPKGDSPECSCCSGMPSLHSLQNLSFRSFQSLHDAWAAALRVSLANLLGAVLARFEKRQAASRQALVFGCV